MHKTGENSGGAKDGGERSYLAFDVDLAEGDRPGIFKEIPQFTSQKHSGVLSLIEKRGCFVLAQEL